MKGSGEREDGEIQAIKVKWRPEGVQGLMTLKAPAFRGHISRGPGGFLPSLAMTGDARLTSVELIRTPEIWKYSQNQGGCLLFFYDHQNCIISPLK